MLYHLHSYSLLSFAGTVPGPAEGLYAQIHAGLTGTEEAGSEEEKTELAAIQASVQAKFLVKPLWPYRNGMACARAVRASEN